MVSIGDTYRKVIVDANCLIRVEQIDGPHVLGIVVDEPVTINNITLPSDYAGQEVSDLLTSVENRVAGANAWSLMVRHQNSLWETAKAGETLHYRNFHGQFYRGITELQDDGRVAMKVTALVGDWPEYDRPHRNAYGEVREGYAARQVREGAVIQPNATFIFESSGYTDKSSVDPSDMEAIDLSLPPLSKEEEGRIELECFLREIREASESGGNPQERLDRVKELLSN